MTTCASFWAHPAVSESTVPRGKPGLRIEYDEGPPASPQDIARLQSLHPGLPEDYLGWIGAKARRDMRVVDGDNTETYRLLGVGESLAKHEELIGWLHLHDESSPDLAAEIRQAIADRGIDPLRMFPVVGADHTPDCFLVHPDVFDRDARGFEPPLARRDFVHLETNLSPPSVRA